MQMLATMVPIAMVMAVGYVLGRGRFLDGGWIVACNRLAYYVALPALIVGSIAGTGWPQSRFLIYFAVLVACTLIAMGAVFLLAGRRSSDALRATLVHTATRGNLAYVSIPVLSYSLQVRPGAGADDLIAGSMVLMGALFIVYNVLAVLTFATVPGHGSGALWRRALMSLATNPIILACAVGLGLAVLQTALPLPLARFLEILGAAALPLALLCIGGSLTGLSFHHFSRPVWGAAGVKLFLLPMLAAAACWWLGLQGVEARIVLVMAAAPTAATAFTMTSQLGGDDRTAALVIGLTTLLAVLPLSVILLVT
jgi:predicted permease